MSIDKLKTKFVTGAFINDAKHFFKKINEIIDWINNVGSTAVPNYKIYRALLTQTGTDAPTAIILENTFDNLPIWSYRATGDYRLTLNNAFKINKTSIIIGNEGNTHFYSMLFFNDQPNQISVFTSLFTNIGGGDNDLLFNTTIEIRVYN